MIPAEVPQSTPNDPPRPIPRSKLVYALADEARWELLEILSDGEGHMIKDLARQIGKSTSATSKQLKALRYAGIVQTHNRLHRLVAGFRPAPGTREIDFGHCIVRLGK